MFQQCLVLQDLQFVRAETEAQTIAKELASDQDNIPPPSSSGLMSGYSTQEQWASILEPVTVTTLLDTVIAMTETLTGACNLEAFQDESRLSWIENFYRDNVEHMFAKYVGSNNEHPEAFLARASFLCAYADANFRAGRLDLPSYERELQKNFAMEWDLSTSPQGLCDRADAMLAFNSSVRTCINYADLQSSDVARLNQTQWRHLSNSLTDLKLASTLPEVQNLARIHLRRGDCELFRCRLGEAPTSYQVARSNTVMLLKNAETYYRGAAGVAQAEGADREEYEARVKEGIVSSIRGDDTKILEILREESNRAISLLEDAQDEGLITSHFLQALNLI